MRKLIVSERVLSVAKSSWHRFHGMIRAQRLFLRQLGTILERATLGRARKVKILINFLVGAFFVALPVFAIDYNLLAPVSQRQSVGGANIFGEYMANFIPFVLVFAAMAAVVQMVIGGFEWALSEAITNKQEAKDRIAGALWGLTLALASFLILNTINPKLTSLQLVVPPINKPVAQTPTGNPPLPPPSGVNKWGLYLCTDPPKDPGCPNITIGSQLPIPHSTHNTEQKCVEAGEFKRPDSSKTLADGTIITFWKCELIPNPSG